MVSPRTHAGPAPAAVGYNLAAIALALALGGLGVAHVINAARQAAALPAAAATSDPALTRSIGGRDLEIPVTWFRYGEQPEAGFVSQVELQLHLPLGVDGALLPVDVTLLPPSRVRPSARLLDGVYLHRFGTDEAEGPPGLVGKPLRGNEGFAGETVWYDPLTADPFVAKCSEPVAPGAAARCLRAVTLGPGLAALYAFDAEVLVNWKRFDAEIRQRLEAIGAY
ncbi:MAG TPA: hypothetical protein VGN80_18360 [Devosiaceae bacterium]|jgi:hypothetical protein|nr:hypothetical protein [Devosiaceae bacterium]